MKDVFARVMGATLVVLIGSAAPPSVRADNISTSLAECQAMQPSQVDVRRHSEGVSTQDTVDTARWVACAIPRLPQSLGTTSGFFTVTGHNHDGGATMTCTITSYDTFGTFLGAFTFTASGTHFAQQIIVPESQLPYWAYPSLVCALPVNGRATLESVVQVQ
jgi:hypothetical protein